MLVRNKMIVNTFNLYVKVDSTGVTVIYGSYHICNMVQATIITYNAYDIDGNSGAPYFRQSGGSYIIAGNKSSFLFVSIPKYAA